METLHTTIQSATKRMMLSLVISEALQELDKAREKEIKKR